MRFDDDAIQRYSRNILLPGVGGAGQRRLLGATVALVGAGGLGSPAALYLAAAGVGALRIIDDDTVELSNLQRQIAHGTPDVGRAKAESAAAAAARINPGARAESHAVRLRAANARALLGGADAVLDGSDNFATRYLVNDACHLLGVPLVSGAILQFEGQAAVFPHTPGGGAPCYRCLFPDPPRDGEVPTCSQAGVLGALAGVVGSLMAMEALKLLLGIGEPLSGRLLRYDGLRAGFREVRFRRDPACALCGDAPTITELRDLPGTECGG
ncbi:MAG: molybdopterin-synthase adenylyltransferase MoeB [Candidatus Sumerlaeia bacterium]|nr:molybdopterin-synthase adenylyltransferase MoeB [Candidatus Sumerlaeia bacterium]